MQTTPPRNLPDHSLPASKNSPRRSPNDAFIAAHDYDWKERPEHFAAFYERTRFFSPAAIVSRFLDARTAALETFIDCRAQDRLLDIGCGSGVHMIRFLGRCREVAGVDYSEAMIALARGTLERSRHTNWELHCADAGSLPFQSNSFDIVIGMGLLDYVPRVSDVLAEISRVLKHGGQAILTIPKAPSIFSPLRTPLGNIVKRQLFNLPPVGNVQTRDSLQALLESAGLQVQAIRSIWTAMWIVKAVRV